MALTQKILVVGGAGFIGSHMVWKLAEEDAQVVTLDNLSTGHRDAVLSGVFVQGDCGDRDILKKLFQDHQFDVVMHFASSIEVAESVRNPAKYYHNNVVKTLTVLDMMREFGVSKFIFSSSAAVYGNPEYIPIDEGHPKKPINPYGFSKLIIEQVLSDYDKAYGLKSICFRYFNAAGAHPDGILGERHNPESHLIPLALDAAGNLSKKIMVFGADYDTPDGTCIRDYVHVQDIVGAHWLGVKKLINGSDSCIYNLGNGNGYSVSNVIKSTKSITRLPIQVEKAVRRLGDPAQLVANSSLAKSELDWTPQYNNLDSIIEHAWKWKCISSTSLSI